MNWSAVIKISNHDWPRIILRPCRTLAVRGRVYGSAKTNEHLLFVLRIETPPYKCAGRLENFVVNRKNFIPQTYMQKIPVGFEVTELEDGRTLVLGIVAVFDTHSTRITDIHALAEIFAQYPLEPARVPAEEGWQGMVDLPDSMWYELQLLIAERMKSLQR